MGSLLPYKINGHSQVKYASGRALTQAKPRLVTVSCMWQTYNTHRAPHTTHHSSHSTHGTRQPRYSTGCRAHTAHITHQPQHQTLSIHKPTPSPAPHLQQHQQPEARRSTRWIHRHVDVALPSNALSMMLCQVVLYQAMLCQVMLYQAMLYQVVPC